MAVSVTVNLICKVHNLSHLADVVIVLFLNLCDSNVLSLSLSESLVPVLHSHLTVLQQGSVHDIYIMIT